jgi:hypothetical protein
MESLWTPTAKKLESFDALKLALSSAPSLLTFDPQAARRAPRDADDRCEQRCHGGESPPPAILTQPDDKGHQHSVACESRKLTSAEWNYPARHDVLELLAVVPSHALNVKVFRQ